MKRLGFASKKKMRDTGGCNGERYLRVSHICHPQDSESSIPRGIGVVLCLTLRWVEGGLMESLLASL